MVNAGGEFRLPCFLETMSDYVLVWKFSGSGQTDTILSVDQKVIDREEGGRVRVEKEDSGNWLVKIIEMLTTYCLRSSSRSLLTF